jgi:hypothetical protein
MSKVRIALYICIPILIGIYIYYLINGGIFEKIGSTVGVALYGHVLYKMLKQPTKF